MNGIIRKVIVGTDVIKDSMVYTVGQRFGNMEVTEIIQEEDKSIIIYVQREDEKFLWKQMSPSVATTVEYSTNF